MSHNSRDTDIICNPDIYKNLSIRELAESINFIAQTAWDAGWACGTSSYGGGEFERYEEIPLYVHTLLAALDKKG